MLKRFELEARATASLTSEHTINLFDYGVTDEACSTTSWRCWTAWISSMLVRRFGSLPPARVAHLLAQACDSLEEAHASGLIHRDIKPANIYVCRSGRRFDFIKVLDFGLVAKFTLSRHGCAPDTAPAGRPARRPPWRPKWRAAGRSTGARISTRSAASRTGC